MKWRLLEGGGQAYYELGVADSGMLIGLPRAELEQSLETLEMMAAEIGASVIVVKEIEVPAIMAGLAGDQTDEWNGKRMQKRHDALEADMSAEDSASDSTAIFSMDSDFDSTADPDSSDLDLDAAPPRPQFSIDLEIASVFKPRPMRVKAHTHMPPPPKNKRFPKPKKGKHLPDSIEQPVPQYSNKALKRRHARDRKREERQQALMVYATSALEEPRACTAVDAQEDAALVSGLEALHVSLDEPVPLEHSIPTLELTPGDDPVDDDDDDDVFASPMTATPFTAFASQLTVPVETSILAHGKDAGSALPRLIVEALVVRKMSLEEAFLDFGGFSLT
jgi:hypothetical protein